MSFELSISYVRNLKTLCKADALPVTPAESIRRKIIRQQKWAAMTKEERNAEREKRQRKKAARTKFITG